MSRLLHWVRAFCRRPEFPGAEAWGNDEALRLASFLGSHTGGQLKRALTNASIREAFRATQIVKSAEYDAGYAAGFRGAIAFLDALSVSTPPEVDANPEDTATQGAEESAIPTP